MQVEELGRPFVFDLVLDKFVALVAHAPLNILIGEEEGVPELPLPADNPGEIASLHRAGNRHAGQVAESREDVQ
ncbi:hypothetical protein ES703_118457 [subsurface metagenome]